MVPTPSTDLPNWRNIEYLRWIAFYHLKGSDRQKLGKSRFMPFRSAFGRSKRKLSLSEFELCSPISFSVPLGYLHDNAIGSILNYFSEMLAGILTDDLVVQLATSEVEKPCLENTFNA